MMLKILVYPVGSEPRVQEIEGSLESMQQAVGGDIQMVNLGAISGIDELAAYDLVCNEDGKIEGLEPNRSFAYDIIAGQFFITKVNSVGEEIPLTDDDIELITKYIK